MKHKQPCSVFELKLPITFPVTPICVCVCRTFQQSFNPQTEPDYFSFFLKYEFLLGKEGRRFKQNCQNINIGIVTTLILFDINIILVLRQPPLRLLVQCWVNFPSWSVQCFFVLTSLQYVTGYTRLHCTNS